MSPVDGAVLKVILRKAEKIRKELGVSVPLPSDNNQVMETLMQTVLLRTGGVGKSSGQLALNFGQEEKKLDMAWESAREKAKESRTIFAQRRLRPDEVLPEWHKAVAVLGGEEDVRRFLTLSAERLKATLESLKAGHFRLPVDFLPLLLRERLLALGIEKPLKLTFSLPAPAPVEPIHRAHPLVAALADYLAEQALAEEIPDLAARSGALFTNEVTERTTLYLLRLRSQLAVETLKSGRPAGRRDLLSEECLAVKAKGGNLNVLNETEAVRLFSAEPSRNMRSEQRARQIERVLDELPGFGASLEALAEQRAKELLEDHTRVRTASLGRGEAFGVRYHVKPCLPVDIIGAYVLIPTPKL